MKISELVSSKIRKVFLLFDLFNLISKYMPIVMNFFEENLLSYYFVSFS